MEYRANPFWCIVHACTLWALSLSNILVLWHEVSETLRYIAVAHSIESCRPFNFHHKCGARCMLIRANSCINRLNTILVLGMRLAKHMQKVAKINTCTFADNIVQQTMFSYGCHSLCAVIRYFTGKALAIHVYVQRVLLISFRLLSFRLLRCISLTLPT